MKINRLLRAISIITILLGSQCRDYSQTTNTPSLTVSQLIEIAKNDGVALTMRTNHLMTLFGSTETTTYFAKGRRSIVDNGFMSVVKLMAALDYRGTNYLYLHDGGQFYDCMFLARDDGTLRSIFYLESGKPYKDVTTNQWAIDQFKTDQKFWSNWAHTNQSNSASRN